MIASLFAMHIRLHGGDLGQTHVLLIFSATKPLILQVCARTIWLRSGAGYRTDLGDSSIAAPDLFARTFHSHFETPPVYDNPSWSNSSPISPGSRHESQHTAATARTGPQAPQARPAAARAGGGEAAALGVPALASRGRRAAHPGVRARLLIWPLGRTSPSHSVRWEGEAPAEPS